MNKNIKQQIKQIMKYYLPPIFFDKINYLRACKEFLKYKDLVIKNIELKDKHKGNRCFILGSGPSIKKEDLKPLKNEIVFALNNFYVHEDFDIIMSGDKPKYYMTAPTHSPQTENEWKDWFSDMEKYVPKTTTMLLGLNNYKGNIKYIFDKHGLFKEYKINWYYTGINVNEYYKFNKKNIDITKIIWNANAVSIYALIWAIYMGFEEIYFVGIDHNYICVKKESDYRFYKNALHQKDEIKRSFKDNICMRHSLYATSLIFLEYEILNKNFSQKIYNCSNESLIDIFNKKDFKKIISSG